MFSEIFKWSFCNRISIFPNFPMSTQSLPHIYEHVHKLCQNTNTKIIYVTTKLATTENAMD